jgi:hypothetical protein
MEITPAQADALKCRLVTHLRFLNRLCDRLNALSVPPDDPLVLAAHRARESMQDLHVACHYHSCTHGVGKIPNASQVSETSELPASKKTE